VKAALESARASESRTLGDQVRFCEVPAPPFNEAARADLLQRAFIAAQLENVRIDKAGNVIGDFPGATPRPRVVVAAHLDTVFPEGTTTTVTRSANVLRGPGIGDNCRGLAVLVAIARVMKEARVRTPGTVTFVANVGEEGLGDLRGVKALFGETLRGQIDRFVAIDNAGLSISAIAVGSIRYRVTFNGPGGHSFAEFGTPNPANALGRAVARIAEFRVAASPRTTFNIGRIGGGTSVNAIPSEAWMEVDLRSSDARTLAELEGRFHRAVDSAVVEENARWGRTPGVTVSKERVGNRPAGATSPSAPLVRTAEAVARALGLVAQPSESSSDANLPMSLGIPAIAIGGGGEATGSHSEAERFDSTNSWQGTQNAVLLTIALAQN
jgi:acetylornithine deacetylase/succinyl-diaminopimelate desuccinylase-like protein